MTIAGLLQDYQGSLTQEEYAERLGITQGGLSLIYSGKRGVGPAVLGAFLRAFPEAAPKVTAILAGHPLPEREQEAAGVA